MIGETVAQVKGSKPRFKPAGKTSEITRQRVSELSEAYLEVRNSKLRAQAFMAETQAKEKAGELLSKALVTRQAQYIFICLRQAILNFPSLYARRVVGIARRTPSQSGAHQGRSRIPRGTGELSREGHQSQLAPEPRSRWSGKSLFVHRAASKSRLKRRRPSDAENRKPRRCANCEPRRRSLDPRFRHRHNNIRCSCLCRRRRP